jgi:peptidoglycan hydrolase-like protein with peptidoglycan-binding domain
VAGTYYEVQPGDCLSSITKQFGFSNYETIYLHPENADFRQQRPNPNIVCPGDVLFIPDRTVQEVSRGTDQQHVFQLNRPKILLRLCLKDDVHQPYQNTKYHLRVGFDEYDGSTDGAGMVEHEIPADATKGEITIYPGANCPEYTFELRLGDLDPIDETNGIDARLSNLGFGPAESTDYHLSDDERAEAIAAFQERFGLDVTGEVDDATRSKLRKLHDNE